jgi:PAS domain S-box-containing protein
MNTSTASEVDANYQAIAPSSQQQQQQQQLQKEDANIERESTDENSNTPAGAMLLSSSDQFRILVESVKDYAIFMLDPAGYVISWNTGAASIKGYQTEEILGKHFSIFYSSSDQQQYKPQIHLEQALANGKLEIEGWRVRKDGTQFWAQVIITPLFDKAGDGHLQGFVKITRDITERKVEAEKLAQLKASLEQHVVERTQRLEQSVERHQDLEAKLSLLLETSSSHLANVLPLENLFPAILELATQLIEADAYALWRFVENSSTWHILAAVGLSNNHMQTIMHENVDSFKLKQPLVVSDIETISILKLRKEAYKQEGIRALLVIPLQIQGQISGSLAFYYKQPHHFSELELRVATTLATIAGATIGNLELHELQHNLRLEAEATQKRQNFLREASKLLTSSLDYETTLARVAQMLVPQLADWCSIYLGAAAPPTPKSSDLNYAPNKANLSESSTNKEPNPLIVAHIDPSKIERIEQLRQKLALRYPYNPNSSHGLAKVLRTGESEVYFDLPKALVQAAELDKELWEFIEELGPTSSILVGLNARSRVLGAIQLITTKESGRHYSSADVQLAEELGRIAGMAIDNAALYREAQVAIERQQQLDHLKDEFLSIAGHELRTPLTTIKGFVQMLHRNLHKKQVGHIYTQAELEQEQHSLETILRQTNNMYELIREMLDITRIQRGKLELCYQPNVKIVRILEQIVEQQQAADNNKHLLQIQLGASVVTAKQTLLVNCDPARIEQVLNNLIGNALKYSGPSKPVVVGLDLIIHPNPNPANIADVATTSTIDILCWVQDEGIGISAEKLPHLFEQFYRAHTTEDQFIDGLGLGLYICHQIIEQHQGHLWVESELGKGSTFYFTLPLLGDSSLLPTTV